MSDIQKQFFAKASVMAGDLEHKRKIAFNIDKYNDSFNKGKLQFANLELAKRKAKNYKWRAIEYLEHNLVQFENNFTNNGGKVLWAEDAEEAQELILEICRLNETDTVVKAKSMVTEEIGLNKLLHENDIDVVETDLGEYIQQLDGEPPYHIVTPAMHKSKEDVARVFNHKLGTPPGLSPQEITQVAREKLRSKFTKAQVGITGANFLLADIGGISITENEGNARLSAAFPPVMIAIVGIEKLLISYQELQLFLPLLATHGTGQHLTVYNTIYTGPRKPYETDGPQEMYVILLDNGRTKLLRKEMRESLYCIRCGACLNACPVYKNIGGHAYGATYTGPIGAVITPHIKGMEQYKHLSNASTLCGNCTEVCPVKINLHEMLLENRIIAHKETPQSLTENAAWAVWKKSMLSRKILNFGGNKLKNGVVNKLFKANWATHRGNIEFASQSFNAWWKENKS